MAWKWQSYGERRDTGVRAFALLPGGIALRFQDGSTYVYTAEVPGPLHVEQMQALAERGAGLTTYVNRHVRESFAQKLTGAMKAVTRDA